MLRGGAVGACWVCVAFQSLIGRLVTTNTRPRSVLRYMFQSLIGRLVTGKREEREREKSEFQSLIGRLVTVFLRVSAFLRPSWFQSLIGRLVTQFFRERSPRYACFNPL